MSHRVTSTCQTRDSCLDGKLSYSIYIFLKCHRIFLSLILGLYMHRVVLRRGNGSYSKGKLQTSLPKGCNEHLDFLNTATFCVQILFSGWQHYCCEITWEAIEQWCRIDGTHRKGCPEAGLPASNHQLALSIRLGNRTQISRLPPTSRKPRCNLSWVFCSAFLCEQVAEIQLCIMDVQRQNIDCRLRDFSEIINKREETQEVDIKLYGL